jgi:hypothetical protein
MTIIFRITDEMLRRVRDDLARRHEFASERVGFLSCKVGAPEDNGVIVLADAYHPMADEDYEDDQRFGAKFGPTGMRKALQIAHKQNASMFHVHAHPHSGAPWFSRIDLRENARFVPDFWNVRPHLPHGALVVSTDEVAGLCWYPGVAVPLRLRDIVVVGRPMRLMRRMP